MFSTTGLYVPFEEKIDGLLETGQTLTVCGQITGDRVNVNLKASHSEIPFHMSARVGQNQFVFNAMENGTWGKEEMAKLNFKAGEHFHFHIRPHGDHIEIYSKGEKVHDFKYRLSLNKVTSFSVDGDASLGYAKISGKYHSMPFEQEMKPFQQLDIQGIVEQDADRIEINLCAGHDIALHINPRMGEKSIVLNAKDSSGWGEEVRNAGNMPLVKKQMFDLTIVNGHSAFVVHINGQEFTTFTHRIKPSNINKLEIKGSVVLTDVRVK
jgi:hypothetical protein